MRLSLPLGIDDFAKIRGNHYYYIDKTAFIKELLDTQLEANLITRPRRFGKSLTISMLEDFFDISRDSKAHFEGLEISKEIELCEKWLNQWPVVALTMKSVEGNNFQDANNSNLKNSLVLLMRMMNAHYGRPVILLIDEYDVPLAKASEHGYYDEMMSVIRALLGDAIKTNLYLKFAVITGCLRISKESIFTGVNNLVTDGITGNRFNEYIGFTPAEVQRMLSDAELLDHMDAVKEWYDGYRFGKVEVYCPWAVLNYVHALQRDPETQPDTYWGNTSGNGIIRHYIHQNLGNVRSDMNMLMEGGVLITQIEKNLTYDYLKSTPQNFWSLLYLTGYLTNADPAEVTGPIPKGYVALRIPNKEVREVFDDNIREWFSGYVMKLNRAEICDAIWNGDVDTAQRLLSALLLKSISYHDYRENFYHAFLAGLFAGNECAVETNQEYGVGRPDVVIRDDNRQRALVIEVKYAKTETEILTKFWEAQQQFVTERYLEGIPDDYTTIIGYCALFYQKKCFLQKVPG